MARFAAFSALIVALLAGLRPLMPTCRLRLAAFYANYVGVL